MSEYPIVKQSPGWWHVIDYAGGYGYYEFREDGRARPLRGKFWDWNHIQGTWVRVLSPEFLEWANLDPKPTAVVGEPDFLEVYKKDYEVRKLTGW